MIVIITTLGCGIIASFVIMALALIWVVPRLADANRNLMEEKEPGRERAELRPVSRSGR
jgi:hypothetical protein